MGTSAARAGASGGRRRRIAGVAVLLVAVGMLPAAAHSTGGTEHAAAASAGVGLWIVQLADPSLAAYRGGIRGLAPTSPRTTGADRLDVAAPASRAYLAHLKGRQAAFAAQATRVLGRAVRLERGYRNVLNAVTVDLSRAEAARLARLPEVAAVWPERVRELDTDASPQLVGAAEVWGGDTGAGVATRGEGVLVGVLDTGINPEHPSFAATDGDGYTHTNPFGAGNYVGVCDPDNPQFDPSFGCTDKLVGAWVFDSRAASARDTGGHGSHTASTAAGNRHQAAVAIGDVEFTRTVQGVAPRANLISYLVCASDCPESAILAGVNQAVADGVDVLNYSISGGDNPWNDPVDLAFLEAFNAGVFVSASAGNDGPGAGTVAKTGPWNASVAASTNARAFVNTLADLQRGGQPGPDDIAGKGLTAGYGPAPVVYAGDFGNPLCGVGSLENPVNPFAPGTFDGQIVVCDRGTFARVDKARHVAEAGAGGFVLANDEANGDSLSADPYAIPGVHIGYQDGMALKAWIAAGGGADNPGTAVIAGFEIDRSPEVADVMASFSSRGPSQFDVLAPTVTAPGVEILAASAGGPGAYAILQGTSMASPHVAGAGALLAALHPDWSPARIRSALAASADPGGVVTQDGATPADPFDMGSGRLDVAAAGRAGLVLDETYDHFRDADPAQGGDPRTLNLPAMVDHRCEATCSWTRTLTSVAEATATYTTTVQAPQGVSVQADPATFTIEPGQSREVTITATVTGAPPDQWAFAAVQWSTDAAHPGGAPIADARLPVAVVPTPARFTVDPGEVTGVQGPGEQVAHTLTIANPGGQDLTWAVVEDQPAVDPVNRPADDATRVATTDPPRAGAAAGEFGLARNTQGPANSVPRPRPPAPEATDLPDGEVTITHSASQQIAPQNSVACALLGTGRTVANGYLRTFTLDDFLVFSDFEVTEVSFGVEAVNFSPVTVTVNLYTQDAEPFIYANMTKIGSAEMTLQPQGPTLVQVPVTGTAPASSTLVVEVDAPDVSGSAGFFIGSNHAGQSAPSYLRAAQCGNIGPEPVDLADLGMPDMHIVMSVTGQAQAPNTELPGWVDIQPTAGTVAPGGQQEVTVTFDSTGLPAGTHEANLLLKSNDPDRPAAIVPLALTVDDDSGQPPAASQDIVATVPEQPGEGSLIISVDPDDRTVTLPPVQLAGSGDRLATTGQLRPVTVTDTRAAANPGWDTSAQVSDFSSQTASFQGGFLGWGPQVVSQSQGQTVTPGGQVAPGFPTGDGLSVPQQLAGAEAGAGVGVAKLDAALALEVPTTTPAGTYTAVLTLTAI